MLEGRPRRWLRRLAIPLACAALSVCLVTGLELLNGHVLHWIRLYNDMRPAGSLWTLIVALGAAVNLNQSFRRRWWTGLVVAALGGVAFWGLDWALTTDLFSEELDRLFWERFLPLLYGVTFGAFAWPLAPACLRLLGWVTKSGSKSEWKPGDYAGLARLVDSRTPELKPILRTAVRALGSGFGDVLTHAPATGSRDVAGAVYEATRCSTDLLYDFEPANPGADHQEVRLAEEVLSTRSATCLDLALLYAALLERAHLAPAVVVLRLRDGGWHATGGFFDGGAHATVPEVLGDAEKIRALVRRGALVPVEATGLSTSRGVKRSYARACDEAERAVMDAEPLAVLNVLAARSKGVLPPD